MKKLTLKKQGELVYTLSRYNPPTIQIDSGETILVETEDAWTGQVRKEGDRRNYNNMPYGNISQDPYTLRAQRQETASP